MDHNIVMEQTWLLAMTLALQPSNNKIKLKLIENIIDIVEFARFNCDDANLMTAILHFLVELFFNIAVIQHDEILDVLARAKIIVRNLQAW